MKKQYIKVDEVVASTATYINGGETIRLSIPDENKPEPILDLPLKVLFEDEYLAVVHKPAGVIVSGNRHKTVANALPHSLKRSDLTDATTPQPAHRLDFATTGILLVGKTNEAIRTLNKLFEDKEIEKTYYAVTTGSMEEYRTITSKIDDKESETEYRVVSTATSHRFGVLNLIQVNPHTGRRHQIRKHLASIGHPILGDKEYGQEDLILKGKGLFLHAYSLKFEHPFTRKRSI